MTTDGFTKAARKRAEQLVPLDGGEPNLIFRDRRELVEMAEWARAYLAERCTACGEDPAGPLRPLSTDERSYRYAQDLGYELPEDPR